MSLNEFSKHEEDIQETFILSSYTLHLPLCHPLKMRHLKYDLIAFRDLHFTFNFIKNVARFVVSFYRFLLPKVTGAFMMIVESKVKLTLFLFSLIRSKTHFNNLFSSVSIRNAISFNQRENLNKL